MTTEGATEVASMILKKFGKFFKRQYEEINETKISIFNNNQEETCYPIKIESSMKENISVMDLVESDNVLVNKILIVFSSLCIEIIHLKEEAISRHYFFISLYGDFEGTKKDSILQHVSQHMEGLCKLNSFISRCQEVCKNILSQIFALFTSELITLNGARLHYIIDNVGELLEILVTLELLIAYSPIVEHWMAFKKYTKQIFFSPKKYNFTEERLKALEVTLKDMDSKILPEKIFQFTLNSLLILRQTLAEKSCAPIATEFNVYIKNAVSELDKATNDIFESWQIRKWMKVNALFVLNCFLFGNTDKKMFRSLVEVNVKAHSIPLYGTAMWYPEQFLQRYLPALCQAHGKLSQMMVKSRQTYIVNKKSTISRDANSAQTATTQWVLALEVAFQNSDTRPDAAQMNQRSQLLLKGIDLASQINFLITVILNMHLSQGIPVTKSLLISVFRLLELLKGIRDVLLKKNAVISTSNNMIIQHLIFQTVSLIMNMKKGLMNDKNYARQRLDELTSMVVAERALRGPVTLQRRVLAKTALSLIPVASHSEDTYTKLDLLLSRIDSLSNIYQNIDSLCNGSHLYFHKTIIPIYMTQFFTRKYDAINMKYLFDSLNDCSTMLSDVETVCGSSYDLFNKDMQNSLHDCILQPVGQQIETNLRLHIHSHLQLDPVNPFINLIENNKPLLQAKNLRFVNEYLSINLSVEHYLSNMFYNLTTVVLHDWKTYGEMRQLAKFKFNLETVQDNLPTQTLEQGLDVLEIMRNIHIFVSKYLYNLNNQIFIEQSSNNKYLNSINITHVANSIRTHGTGIMNTTVNFTYQFLRKKFYTFSQFMYDEHIKSRLIKDLRKFRETALEAGNMYSYKNADKFNKGIRNLGISEGGQSYLDLFRILISQIGNAMGYVRMIRSGGRHCCANSTAFLPSLDATLNFEEMCRNEHLSLLTIAAADNLEHTINTMTTNFAQGTEYFKLLVDVFAPVFRNKKNVHLKNFYMIVPPLTINFVENMILSKDKMTKKNKDGAAFTDDGFAMGLAYILKLLDQDNDLNSLHWFQSVWKHIADERSALEAQRLKGSAQLQQALALTEKKFHILDEEFQMLYFSFSSARIFFQ